MHYLFLCTFWFQPQLYHSWAWLSSFLMFGFYCWYTLFESTINFLQARQWKTELQWGMLPMEMFEIIGDWLPCSKTCNSMQLARRENKSKHKSADCILRAGGWVRSGYSSVVKPLKVQDLDSIPKDSTLTFDFLLLCLAPHLFTAEEHVLNIIFILHIPQQWCNEPILN